MPPFADMPPVASVFHDSHSLFVRIEPGDHIAVRGGSNDRWRHGIYAGSLKVIIAAGAEQEWGEFAARETEFAWVHYTGVDGGVLPLEETLRLARSVEGNGHTNCEHFATFLRCKRWEGAWVNLCLFLDGYTAPPLPAGLK
jgi:hypothetical protein